LIEAAVDDLYLWDANSSTSISDIKTDNSSQLIKIVDVLGREVDPAQVVEKTTLFYIYDDGRVEKRIILE